MLQLPGLLLQLTSHPGSIVTSVIIFSQTNFDHLMLTFPNVFAWGIKTNNQSLHTCEKQAYISNRVCSRVTETKSVTIAPGLPYVETYIEDELWIGLWMGSRVGGSRGWHTSLYGQESQVVRSGCFTSSRVGAAVSVALQIDTPSYRMLTCCEPCLNLSYKSYQTPTGAISHRSRVTMWPLCLQLSSPSGGRWPANCIYLRM